MKHWKFCALLGFCCIAPHIGFAGLVLGVIFVAFALINMWLDN